MAISVWTHVSQVNACEVESDECWSNDGPHPVISFDSSGLDPARMHVHVFLDGRFLLKLGEPSGEMSVIMRSPHESHTPDVSGRHSVEARIVSLQEGDILARDNFSFVFDLRGPSSGATALAYHTPCPVMQGSNVTFDYRKGDGHGTHQAVLHAAFHATTGPVIEFGMGYFSTPMLHDLCKASGRRLVSMDTASPWVDQFRHLESDFHTILHVTEWEHIPEVEIFFSEKWGLVFIDQHPESARIQVARRIKSNAHFIVMHDAYRQLGQPVFIYIENQYVYMYLYI